MKALIRDEGETVRESDNIPGIDWNTGYPLTDVGWSGGPYTLVDNFIEVADGSIYDVAVYPEPEEEEPEIENEDDYVVIDGKRYSKAELRRLIE